MTWDAASAPAAGPRLRVVPDLESAPAGVVPITLPTRAAIRRRRPLFERLRSQLPCRSDATELRTALATLGPAWRIVRGLADDGVHYLLVGPAGVFTLTVQSLPNARMAVAGDTVTADGRPLPVVKQRRMVADNLGRRLSHTLGTEVRVRSILGVIHAQPRWSFREQPADGRVAVLPGRDIAAFLAAQAPLLGPAEVLAVAAAAVAPVRPNRPALYAV